MDLVNDLGNELAVAMLVEKKHSEKIDSKDVLSLICRIREVLEPVSSRDHSHMPLNVIVNETSISHQTAIQRFGAR